MIFIGNREDRVSTLSGHTVYFPGPGAEVFVPDIPKVIEAVKNRGHLRKETPKPVAPEVARPLAFTKNPGGAKKPAAATTSEE